MHPRFIFENVMKGQFMRASRLNPTDSGYLTEIRDLERRLLDRQYNIRDINRNMTLVHDLRDSRARPYFSEWDDVGHVPPTNVKEQLKVLLFFTRDVKETEEVIVNIGMF